MEREIKFRGLAYSGFWVYGDLVNTDDSDYILSVWFIPAKSLPAESFIEVSPKSIGQFTEIKDKNGVDIYGGAIYRNGDNEIYCISEDGQYGSVSFHEFIYNVLYSESHSGLWGNGRKDIEVLGNIHENKDLLL